MSADLCAWLSNAFRSLQVSQHIISALAKALTCQRETDEVLSDVTNLSGIIAIGLESCNKMSQTGKVRKRGPWHGRDIAASMTADWFCVAAERSTAMALLEKRRPTSFSASAKAIRLSTAGLAAACAVIGGAMAEEQPREPEPIKIVGIGAVSCATYVREIWSNPPKQDAYIAWAQGFMSAILMRAPPGKDLDLDLLPPHYPLIRQAAFLQNYCTQNGAAGFSEAVVQLYLVLRAPPS